MLNYMAAGLPVVAFCGAAEPVVDGVSGILVKSSDCKGFAQAVVSLLKKPDLARKMGQEGMRIVERFYTWDEISGDIERIYYRLIGCN